MKSHPRKHRRKRVALRASIRRVEEIRQIAVVSSNGRFGFYQYLEAVYQFHYALKLQRCARRTARKLAKLYDIPIRRGASILRILIDLTFRESDTKRRSRWVRALEHAYNERIGPNEIINFMRANKGAAGCAVQAALLDPKKALDRNDWD